ncbi:MobC family plasmid mobilization relaxosome protein [Tenacibaculum finnmarkense]|uniref:plasmid mobilization protein n=1 Tax=Tenacibaculum finnmarkense TaxID=2781243 RepID=UPI001E43FE0E|nr:plasmid mobilization relaxosome protein MobC [Tenacibaculum finnmarkense]MCD8428632.1 MobC family plasmid mobilization relaxosome protein [Tenacibaculum finnmarkense genomovar ulcerans]MCG8722636.1 MobC family plasmid mobilization relaxosome protein [Tenacibaculum finnmarkense]
MKLKLNNKVKVVFYLNSEDKEIIKIQCESLQIKPSFFYRNAVLEKLGKPIFIKKFHDLDTKKYLTSLIKIGNNLNQISKKLNSNAQFLIADQQVVLDEIKNINNHIIEINSKL